MGCPVCFCLSYLTLPMGLPQALPHCVCWVYLGGGNEVVQICLSWMYDLCKFSLSSLSSSLALLEVFLFVCFYLANKILYRTLLRWRRAFLRHLCLPLTLSLALVSPSLCRENVASLPSPLGWEYSNCLCLQTPPESGFCTLLSPSLMPSTPSLMFLQLASPIPPSKQTNKKSLRFLLFEMWP